MTDIVKTDIIVTSILHDTIEDTELTFEMIENGFGTVIANQVRSFALEEKMLD